MSVTKTMSRVAVKPAEPAVDRAVLLAELTSLESGREQRFKPLHATVKASETKLREAERALVPYRAEYAAAVADLRRAEHAEEEGYERIRQQLAADLHPAIDPVYRMIVRVEQTVRERFGPRSSGDGGNLEQIHARLAALAEGRAELADLWRHPEPHERLAALCEELDLGD